MSSRDANMLANPHRWPMLNRICLKKYTQVGGRTDAEFGQMHYRYDDEGRKWGFEPEGGEIKWITWEEVEQKLKEGWLID